MKSKDNKLALRMQQLRRLIWVFAGLILLVSWVRAAGEILLNPGRMETAAERYESLQKEALSAAPDLSKRLKPLQERNLFVPKIIPQPPQATQILGDAAFFQDRWVRLGEEIGGAKVVAIDSTSVTLLWEGKEIKQYPFDYKPQGQNQRPTGPDNGQQSRSRTDSGRASSRPSPEGITGFGGRAPWAMSPEERDQLRQRFEQMTPEERQALRSEMRRRFEEGGFGRGRRGGGPEQ
ncbi:MAG TPA: hypothetical protein P5017_01610 [Anaerohalosphaeraceae bacterium]|jgi:hypothetical protein|nr:hypothetical protein [Anaerohalosphaeraceae bacterium]